MSKPFLAFFTLLLKALGVLGFDPKGRQLMKMNLRQGIWVLAVAVGMGVTAGTVPAIGAPFFQDHDQDHDRNYSKNKNYQQGMRDGQYDHAHNKDHSKKRHFKKDDDQKDYESGYQKSHGN